MASPNTRRKATKRHSNCNISFLLMQPFLTVIMGSIPVATVAASSRPSSLCRRNLKGWLGYSINIRGHHHHHHHLSHHSTPKRISSRYQGGVAPYSTFISNFAFKEKMSVSKVNIPIKPFKSTFPPSWGVHSYNAQTTSSFKSYTSRSNINDITNRKELLAQTIPPGTTIYDALHSSLQLLEDNSIPESDESVLHLLSHALNLSWENGYRQLRDVMMLPKPIQPEESSIPLSQTPPIVEFAQQTLTPEQSTTYNTLLERRLQFEPLQYIVGQWDFHYLTGLKIRKPMLCPRPETEELVELALKDIDRLIEQRRQNSSLESNEERRKIRVLDVGCGTGAIGIAIAHRYPNHVQVVALDVLPEAVELSNENAFSFLSDSIGHGMDANEGVDNLYKAILCTAKEFTNNSNESTTGTSNAAIPGHIMFKMDFDIVVSNPPYIPTKDMQYLSNDVVGYESHGALCGGDDGLNVVRDIVHRLPEWVSSSTGTGPNGKEHRRHCWMEVDDSHPSMLAKWLIPGSEESIRWGVEYCDGCKDFCGRDRFVKLRVL